MSLYICKNSKPTIVNNTEDIISTYDEDYNYLDDIASRKGTDEDLDSLSNIDKKERLLAKKVVEEHITADMTEYEKLLVLHDYIVAHVEYFCISDNRMAKSRTWNYEKYPASSADLDAWDEFAQINNLGSIPRFSTMDEIAD